jgi:hypothetical protein
MTNDAWRLFTDHGALKKIRADQPDSMNIETNTVTIINDLPKNFYDGRVRFILDRGEYRVAAHGSIVAQYDCRNGTRRAVLVKVNIPATNSVTVVLAKVAVPQTLPRS